LKQQEPVTLRNVVLQDRQPSDCLSASRFDQAGLPFAPSVHTLCAHPLCTPSVPRAALVFACTLCDGAPADTHTL